MGREVTQRETKTGSSEAQASKKKKDYTHQKKQSNIFQYQCGRIYKILAQVFPKKAQRISFIAERMKTRLICRTVGIMFYAYLQNKKQFLELIIRALKKRRANHVKEQLIKILYEIKTPLHGEKNARYFNQNIVEQLISILPNKKNRSNTKQSKKIIRIIQKLTILLPPESAQQKSILNIWWSQQKQPDKIVQGAIIELLNLQQLKIETYFPHNLPPPVRDASSDQSESENPSSKESIPDQNLESQSKRSEQQSWNFSKRSEEQSQLAQILALLQSSTPPHF